MYIFTKKLSYYNYFSTYFIFPKHMAPTVKPIFVLNFHFPNSSKESRNNFPTFLGSFGNFHKSFYKNPKTSSKTFVNLVNFPRIRCVPLSMPSSVGRGGDAGTSPPRNRKNCCRNLVLSSRGLYFRSGVRNPRNI